MSPAQLPQKSHSSKIINQTVTYEAPSQTQDNDTTGTRNKAISKITGHGHGGAWQSIIILLLHMITLIPTKL